MMRQLLEHLGHQRRGDAIFLSNLIGAASMLLAMHRQVLDGNQAVIGLFGKLEHRSIDLLAKRLRYMRPNQSQMKYIPTFPESQPRAVPDSHTSPVFLTTYTKTRIVSYPENFSERSPAALNGLKSKLSGDCTVYKSGMVAYPFDGGAGWPDTFGYEKNWQAGGLGVQS